MSLFQEIKESAQGRELSIKWYQNRIKHLGGSSLRNPRTLIHDEEGHGVARVRPGWGELNLFQYTPKGPERLKYYDLFPIVLPLVKHRNGFTGLNFHYLPYVLRVKLLTLLAEAYGDEHTQKINATYFMIRNMRLIRPIIRRYIRKQVETLYLRIPLDDMLIGILLPVQQFRTGPLDSSSDVMSREVWRDSREIVTNA